MPQSQTASSDHLEAKYIASICKIKAGFAGLLLLHLTGCASNQALHDFAQTHKTAPIKIWAIQSPTRIDDKRLQALSHDPDEAKQDRASDQAPIQQETDQQKAYLQHQASHAMTQAFKMGTVFVPVESTDDSSSLSRIGEFGSPLGQADADQIAKLTGADVIFRYRVTDYGLTPKA